MMADAPQAPRNEAQALLDRLPLSDPLTQNIPAELTALPRWVAYAAQERGGKVTKPPLNPKLDTPDFASVDKPKTWGTFGETMAFLCSHRGEKFRRNGSLAVVAGVGIVLTPEDGVTGVDLDHCLDPETGAVLPWAKPLIDAMQGAGFYLERSPSGTGLRGFCREPLPPECGQSFKRNGVEAYRDKRYLTVTGHAFGSRGTLRTLPEGQDCRKALLLLWRHAYPEQPKAQGGIDFNGVGPQTPLPKRPSDCTVDELLERAFQAKNGAEVQALFSTPPSEAEDKSAVDLQLANRLAFWSGGDAGRLDSMMRKSARLQPPERLAKWDKRHSGAGLTYGEMTCAKAIKDCPDFYGSRQPQASTGGGQASAPAPALAPWQQQPPPWAQQNAVQALQEEASPLPPAKEPPEGVFPLPLEQAMQNVADVFSGGRRGFAFAALLAMLAHGVSGRMAAAFVPDKPVAANMYILLVARSSSGKSDNFDTFFKYFDIADIENDKNYAFKLRKYNESIVEYNEKMKSATTKEEKDAIEKPKKPYKYHSELYKNLTIESLYDAFENNKRHDFVSFVTLRGDEADDLFSKLDAYKPNGKRGSAVNDLIEMWNGARLKKSRVTSKEASVGRAYLTVTGNTQPVMLKEMFTKKDFLRGFAGRFAIVRAELKNEPKRFSRKRVSDQSYDAILKMTQWLQKLESDIPKTEDGKIDLNPQPTTKRIGVDEDALDAFAEWYDRLSERLWLEGDEKDVLLDKLSMNTSKIALLIHAARLAFGEEQNQHSISLDTVRRALKVGDFLVECESYAWDLLGEKKFKNPAHPATVSLAKAILRHAGEIDASRFVLNATIRAWAAQEGILLDKKTYSARVKPLGLNGARNWQGRGRTISPADLDRLKVFVDAAAEEES